MTQLGDLETYLAAYDGLPGGELSGWAPHEAYDMQRGGAFGGRGLGDEVGGAIGTFLSSPGGVFCLGVGIGVVIGLVVGRR